MPVLPGHHKGNGSYISYALLADLDKSTYPAWVALHSEAEYVFTSKGITDKDCVSFVKANIFEYEYCDLPAYCKNVVIEKLLHTNVFYSDVYVCRGFKELKPVVYHTKIFNLYFDNNYSHEFKYVQLVDNEVIESGNVIKSEILTYDPSDYSVRSWWGNSNTYCMELHSLSDTLRYSLDSLNRVMSIERAEFPLLRYYDGTMSCDTNSRYLWSRGHVRYQNYKCDTYPMKNGGNLCLYHWLNFSPHTCPNALQNRQNATNVVCKVVTEGKTVLNFAERIITTTLQSLEKWLVYMIGEILKGIISELTPLLRTICDLIVNLLTELVVLLYDLLCSINQQFVILELSVLFFVVQFRLNLIQSVMLIIAIIIFVPIKREHYY